MGVKAVIEDRPGTDSVTVTYECSICKTETDRRHKGVSPTKPADPSGSPMFDPEANVWAKPPRKNRTPSGTHVS